MQELWTSDMQNIILYASTSVANVIFGVNILFLYIIIYYNMMSQLYFSNLIEVFSKHRHIPIVDYI